MIPNTFKEWKNCIQKDCGIKLTKAFTENRLRVYENKRNPETQKFIQLYGESHLNNIIHWLKKAQSGTSKA